MPGETKGSWGERVLGRGAGALRRGFGRASRRGFGRATRNTHPAPGQGCSPKLEANAYL